MQPTLPAFEKIESDIRLKVCDKPTDRWLGYVQCLRGSRSKAKMNGRAQRFNLTMVHQQMLI